MRNLVFVDINQSYLYPNITYGDTWLEEIRLLKVFLLLNKNRVLLYFKKFKT